MKTKQTTPSSPTVEPTNVKPLKTKRPRSAVSKKPPTKATIHHLPPTYSRTAEDRILDLAREAREGNIHGMTYVITDQNGLVEVGRIGLHKQNKDIALGTMLRAAVALVMAP